MNKTNIHYFYLTMRPQIADVFCFRMGVTYGSELLRSLHCRLSPLVLGHREEYPAERDLLLAAWNKYLEAMPDVPNPQEQDAVRASSRTRKIMLVSFRIFSMSPFFIADDLLSTALWLLLKVTFNFRTFCTI